MLFKARCFCLPFFVFFNNGYLSFINRNNVVILNFALCTDFIYIINSYYVKIRNPSGTKHCGIGFHGSDNIISNMQVSKSVILKTIIVCIWRKTDVQSLDLETQIFIICLGWELMKHVILYSCFILGTVLIEFAILLVNLHLHRNLH